MVSAIKREIKFDDLSSLIPKLVSNRHKGQNGKIGIIGGSFEYTGAPFYGAAASLRGGGDLAHIFCTEKAATPIKSYSPEIIVHPYLLSESDLKREAEKKEIEDCIKSITKWYDPLNAVVIGSGLGRDNGVSACIEDLYVNLKDIVTVCDGDFFWFLSEKNKEGLMEKIKKRSKVTVLTPNKVEFKRMWDFLKGKEERTSEDIIKQEREKVRSSKAAVVELPIENPLVKDQAEIAKKLDNVNIIEKGEFDIITNGKEAYAVKKEGSQKRCGGQGDVLAGLTALYCYWDFARQKENNIGIDSSEFNLLKGCILSTYITRYSGDKAYQKYKYGLTTPFLLDEVPNAINYFIENGFN